MIRDEIIGMAVDVGLMDKVDNSSDYFIRADAFDDEVVSFAYKLIDAIDAKWLRGEAKMRIPTETMEAEFSNYHRLGYKAGVAAERERCAALCDAYGMPDGTSETALALAAAIRGMK